MVNKKILEAIEFAAIAHKDQARKITAVPYIAHPFAVGILLLNAGYSEDVAIAGILHDVVEDTAYSLKDIESRFGENIAALVAGVTEDNNIVAKEARLEKYLTGIENSNNEVKAICAADMLHNRICVLRELENGVDVWSEFKTTKEKYLQKSYEKLAILRKTLQDNLVLEIARALEAIQKS